MPQPIDLKNGGRFHIVPDYQGDRGLYLESAQHEREMLETTLASQEIPATVKDLRDFFSGPHSKDTSLIHFACHGEATQGAIMSADLILRRIDKGDGTRVEERLSWQTIKANVDFGKGRRPLVFINACQTGKPGESIAGIAGFAEAFLRPMNGTGAGAFIGALWSIDDELATVFSKTVYQVMLGGGTLNEAVRAARKAAQANSDFTWLAYCVYGG
jgi:CHAT domain-containing protein